MAEGLQAHPGRCDMFGEICGDTQGSANRVDVAFGRLWEMRAFACRVLSVVCHCDQKRRAPFPHAFQKTRSWGGVQSCGPRLRRAGPAPRLFQQRARQPSELGEQRPAAAVGPDGC